jgi:hypothetical protein
VTLSVSLKIQENWDREKKIRADVEKVKRKLESDLRATQDAVDELENLKRDLEENVRRLARKTTTKVNVKLTFTRNVSRGVDLCKSLGGHCNGGAAPLSQLKAVLAVATGGGRPLRPENSSKISREISLILVHLGTVNPGFTPFQNWLNLRNLILQLVK